MANPPRRETAKIYRFPTRMRVAGPDVTRERHTEPARIYSVCDYGSGWYHDAAIQDDQSGRKH